MNLKGSFGILCLVIMFTHSATLGQTLPHSWHVIARDAHERTLRSVHYTNGIPVTNEPYENF